MTSSREIGFGEVGFGEETTLSNLGLVQNSTARQLVGQTTLSNRMLFEKALLGSV